MLYKNIAIPLEVSNLCYSGICLFESETGNCQVGDTLEFRDTYGYSPCMVGGFATCSDEEHYIQDHEQELENVRIQYSLDQKRYEGGGYFV